MSPKARHAKSKARLGAYENLLNQDVKQKEDKLEIFIPNGPRLGDKVIEATAVTKSFDDKLLFEDLEFSLPPNGIVGVIGPNGAGKTTLFSMIMGQEQATKGTFTIGETVTLGYVDQAHAAIDPAKTVYEVISGGQNDVMVGNRLVNARAYVARFNFTGADQEKKCGVLSGGERNRLHLALTLKSGANVLLLDEPTNDIDVNTLRALEEGLENFAGCAVIISHDRWFLDRITTHMLAFEGNSKVVWFEGNYSDYEENYKKRVADTTPARIKYKKLVYISQTFSEMNSLVIGIDILRYYKNLKQRTEDCYNVAADFVELATEVEKKYDLLQAYKKRGFNSCVTIVRSFKRSLFSLSKLFSITAKISPFISCRTISGRIFLSVE
jgi:sulfate-transporting ATPase